MAFHLRPQEIHGPQVPALHITAPHPHAHQTHMPPLQLPAQSTPRRQAVPRGRTATTPAPHPAASTPLLQGSMRHQLLAQRPTIRRPLRTGAGAGEVCRPRRRRLWTLQHLVRGMAHRRQRRWMRLRQVVDMERRRLGQDMWRRQGLTMMIRDMNR